MAAAQAIGAIAENVTHVTVKELLATAEAELAQDGRPTDLLEVLVADQNEGGGYSSGKSLTFSG